MEVPETLFAEEFVLVEHQLLRVDLFVGVGEPVVPDAGHALHELLVGANHAVEPPAVILPPGVDGVERFAFFIDRRGAAQNSGTGGAREAVDDLLEGLSRERRRLPGGGPEARAPQQAVGTRLREERGSRGNGGIGRWRWRGGGGGQRHPSGAEMMAMDLAVVALAAMFAVNGVLRVLLVRAVPPAFAMLLVASREPRMVPRAPIVPRPRARVAAMGPAMGPVIPSVHGGRTRREPNESLEVSGRLARTDHARPLG